jgi:MraZ protein
MRGFMGTHTNRVDAKGRVSIPAPFRAVLRAGAVDGPVQVVLRPSHKFACIEGWSAAGFDELLASLDRLATYSDDHEDLAAALAGSAQLLESDKEGRISLPPAMAAHAGITETLSFVGAARSFRIWEPAAAEQRLREANSRLLSDKLSLPAGRVA